MVYYDSTVFNGEPIPNNDGHQSHGLNIPIRLAVFSFVYFVSFVVRLFPVN
jgi:hypothetical protein